MRVELFVPCYVDQLAPQVAEATEALLRRLGCNVSYRSNQVCCGQPYLTAGLTLEAQRLARAHLDVFDSAEVIVCPSSSCVQTVREGFEVLGLAEDAAATRTRESTFELAEFIVTKLGITDVGAYFPHRVGLVRSCHGTPSLTQALLENVNGLELVEPKRPEECCGFGGIFSVTHAEISTQMGNDRLQSFIDVNAEFITGSDMSCLMHLDGFRRRQGEGPRALHLAEILAKATA